MAGGGGSSAPTNQTVTQTNLPDYARPYYTGLMQRAQGLLTQNYTPYTADRIANFTPQQQQVQANILKQGTPTQFGDATNVVNQAAQGTLAAANYKPGEFNAQTVTPEQLQYFQMQGPDSFNSAAAQQYMSPYIQNVIDIQKREALKDAQRGQLAQDLGAARQGTFGGSRQLMASMMRERNLGEQMGDLQAKGLQSAYESAMGQFNTENALRQAARQGNLQAMIGVQELEARNAMQSALANQQYNFEAQRAAEQSRQFGSQQGLAALAQAGQLGQTLTNIGSAQSQAELARLNQQQQVAAQEQALRQQYLDQQYQDFLRQRDYPLEMLQQYSSLLRGVPVQLSSTQSTYAQQPGIAQQLLGTGLGAASIYKAFSGA